MMDQATVDVVSALGYESRWIWISSGVIRARIRDSLLKHDAGPHGVILDNSRGKILADLLQTSRSRARSVIRGNRNATRCLHYYLPRCQPIKKTHAASPFQSSNSVDPLAVIVDGNPKASLVQLATSGISAKASSLRNACQSK